MEQQQFRSQNQIKLEGNDSQNTIYNPIEEMKDTKFRPEIMDRLLQKYSKPTLVQSQGWPIIENNRDCIAIAETGSGKTLGFMIPALQRVMDKKIKRSCRIIILSPTRELATQIVKVFEEVNTNDQIRCVCVYGGVSRRDQIRELERGVSIVVGTPGRVQDLIEDRKLKLSKIEMVVLDEADRMLDMGFEQQIQCVFDNISKQHQTVMFSATWPKSVQNIADRYITDPLKFRIGTEEGSANKNITQQVEVIEPKRKYPRLLQLLKQYNRQTKDAKIILFVLYKAEAERMENQLINDGHDCVSLHGNKDQIQRNKAFQQFMKSEVNLLVATDVAARGLDIPNVHYVINYTFPLTVSDYMHRIGRTGRAGKKGQAYTFFTENEKKMAGELVSVLKEAQQTIPEPLAAFGPSIQKRATHSMYGDHFKEVDMNLKPKKIKLC